MTEPLDSDRGPLEARRPTLDEWRVVRRAHNDLVREVQDMKREFRAHMSASNEAYPGGDRRRHHDGHVTDAQEKIERREFWKKLTLQVIGAGAVLLIGFAGASLLFFIRYGVAP